MPTIHFYKAGQLGIIRDLPPEEIPPGAWSDGNNVRFEDGKIYKAYGSSNVFEPLSASDPIWVMPVYTPTQVFWVYATATQIYATDGSTHANISRTVGGNYATMGTRKWVGGNLSGIPVITNGVDIPQYWAAPGLSTDFADLANWQANTLCEVIKPFKNFLIALNVTKSGTQYQQLVKWSAPAVPGAVPPSWDETDPTTQAGEVELGEDSFGGIRDGLALRDTFIIYKDNSVWGMQFIGGQSVFRFFPIFTSSGILSHHCAKTIRKGTMHFVATGDDIVVHDGQNIDSILDQRWKRWLRNNLSASDYNKSFVTINPMNDEAWFCFPISTEYPERALVWNWRDNALTSRDLAEGTQFIDVGPSSGGGQVWDTDPESWDSDSEFWDALGFRPHAFGLVGANSVSDTLRTHDDETASTFAGVDYTAFVERTGIALVGQDRVSGEFKADYENRKICRRVWVKASGAPFYVQVGSQETNADDPVTYQTAQLFTPGVDKYLDWTANGRYLAIKFYSDSGDIWQIEGFTMEIDVLGGL